MTDDHTAPGGTAGEQELRNLFHGAVAGLEPSDGALERLQAAVPARRTRRRRALVGAAAAVLLAGTAVPTALHLRTTGGEGSVGEHSAMAGHGEDSAAAETGDGPAHHAGGPGDGPHPPQAPGRGIGPGGTGNPPDSAAGGSPDGGHATGEATSGASAGPGTGLGAGPMPPVAASGVPACGAEQLGVQGSARAPEPDGKVYGSFKVTNVSARGCAVVGPDTVTASSVTASAPGKTSGVTVVGHTAGDPAAGLLPDPSAEASVMLLQPYTAYEVRFAWVPSDQSCPAATPDPAAKTPAGGAPKDEPGTADTSAAPGTTARTDGPAPDPAAGVAVTHTPNTAVPGVAPTTQATIPAACGGTVYRTGVIPLETPTPKP